jgi:hypothetical protein
MKKTINPFVILVCLAASTRSENSTNSSSGDTYCELSKYCSSIDTCSNFESLDQLERARPNVSTAECTNSFNYNVIRSIDIYAKMFQGPVSDKLNWDELFFVMLTRDFRPFLVMINFQGFTGIDLNITTNANSYKYILEWKEFFEQYLFRFSQFEFFLIRSY